VAQFVKTGTATSGTTLGSAAQQWADDQQRVSVLGPDLTTVQARGRVAAYHPESVSVRLADGSQVHVPVERVAPLGQADAQTEVDNAVIELLGGGPVARVRYNQLLAAGYTVAPPPP
jgi:hypothetical protein